MTAPAKTAPHAPGRVPFLGVVYDPVSMDEALARITARPADAPFAYVVTPNADHLVRLNKMGGDVARAYHEAWLCLNDSRVVDILARRKNVTLPAVPGADLVAQLCQSPGFDRATPVLLVGGDVATFEAFVAKIGLTHAVHFDAPMGLMTNRQAFDDTVAFIERNPARYIFLAVGSPQQELLAQALMERGVTKGLGLCIGASVEFLVGRRRRAPAWMSRAGLEWFFRLASEPRRLWRRYLVASPQLLRLYAREPRRAKGGS